MAKEEIEISSLSFDEIADIVTREYGLAAPIPADGGRRGFRRLFGGYSGSTFVAPLEDGMTVCIKIANGYDAQEVEDMSQVMAHTARHGFSKGCFPYPLASSSSSSSSSSFQFVLQREDLPGPVLLINYVQGIPADKALREGQVGAIELFESVGSTLGQLHAVPVASVAATSPPSSSSVSFPPPPQRPLRNYRNGGACLLFQHLNGHLLSIIKKSPHTASHPFLRFYESRLTELVAYAGGGGATGRTGDVEEKGRRGRNERGDEEEEEGGGEGGGEEEEEEDDDDNEDADRNNSTLKIPMGVIHGDPFLDNMLVVPGPTPQSPLSAAYWIDFEDTCEGPLLFDVACAIIGSCFVVKEEEEGEEEGTGTGEQTKRSPFLDLSRTRAFLRGYTRERRLTEAEVRLFLPFLRIALLCNCTWRFINFHIDHREIESARNSYLELHDRIEYLMKEDEEKTIMTVVRAVTEGEQGERRREGVGWLGVMAAIAVFTASRRAVQSR